MRKCRGGAAFVATQALGWALSSASLVLLALAVARIAAGVAYCIRCWALATGTLMLAAQLVCCRSSTMSARPLLSASSPLCCWL